VLAFLITLSHRRLACRRAYAAVRLAGSGPARRSRCWPIGRLPGCAGC